MLSKMTPCFSLNFHSFFYLLLLVILSIPPVVFSSIEFPKNSLPYILQETSKLKLENPVFDETHKNLPVKLIAEEGVLSILVDDSTATYPIYLDPLFTSETIIKETSFA